MRPDDIRDFLQKKPFQPFKVTLTDGRTYEVRYPELAMVARSAVAYVAEFQSPTDGH